MNKLEIKNEIQNFVRKSRVLSRKESFLKTFDYIFENKDVSNFTIVETETLRGDREEVIPGDGGSTIIWGGLFSKLTLNK